MSAIHRRMIAPLAAALALLLCACSAASTSPAQETRIAAQVFATQTAQSHSPPTLVAMPAVELGGRGEERPGPPAPLATDTARPSNTPRPTSTPKPTVTSTNTSTPSSTPSPSPTPEPEAIVRASALNVRQGPGDRFAVLEGLSAGMELDVIGQQGGDCAWLWVGYGGKTGWVQGHADWLELRRPCEDIPRGFYREVTGYLKRSNDGNAVGELTVENGTEEDAVVIMTLGGETVTSAYIRAGESFTLQRIGDGSFDVYFATGGDWDGDSFAQIISRRKFDEQLPFTSGGGQYTVWSVTLHPVQGGQALAGRVAEDAFPTTGQ